MNSKSRWLICLILISITCFFTACGVGSTAVPSSQATPAPSVVRVNGFGTAANHVHSLLALPNHVLLLATHYGLFRSADSGTSWQQVTGGSNQVMQGLMDYSLIISPLNQQHLFLLTQSSINPHKGIVGLYTSADQ